MILIDSAVGSRNLISYPPLDSPSLACLTSLSSSPDTKSAADVCFSGKGPSGDITIGIEYKSLSDLLSSIHTGRLRDTQIPTMKAEYAECWILYYGPYRCGETGDLEVPRRSRLGTEWVLFDAPWQKRPIRFSYLERSLLSCHAAGVYHKHVFSPQQAALWIYELYSWWQKPYNEHEFFRCFDRSPDLRKPAIMPSISPDMRVKMEFADRIPGIDYKKSIRIAEHFASVQDMANASVEEWMRIKGVGKTIARVAVERFQKRSGGQKASDTAGNAGHDKPNSINLDLI